MLRNFSIGIRSVHEMDLKITGDIMRFCGLKSGEVLGNITGIYYGARMVRNPTKTW